jgi:hypothetical protein
LAKIATACIDECEDQGLLLGWQKEAYNKWDFSWLDLCSDWLDRIHVSLINGRFATEERVREEEIVWTKDQVSGLKAYQLRGLAQMKLSREQVQSAWFEPIHTEAACRYGIPVEVLLELPRQAVLYHILKKLTPENTHPDNLADEMTPHTWRTWIQRACGLDRSSLNRSPLLVIAKHNSPATLDAIRQACDFTFEEWLAHLMTPERSRVDTGMTPFFALTDEGDVVTLTALQTQMSEAAWQKCIMTPLADLDGEFHRHTGQTPLFAAATSGWRATHTLAVIWPYSAAIWRQLINTPLPHRPAGAEETETVLSKVRKVEDIAVICAIAQYKPEERRAICTARFRYPYPSGYTLLQVVCRSGSLLDLDTLQKICRIEDDEEWERFVNEHMKRTSIIGVPAHLRSDVQKRAPYLSGGRLFFSPPLPPRAAPGTPSLAVAEEEKAPAAKQPREKSGLTPP